MTRRLVLASAVLLAACTSTTRPDSGVAAQTGGTCTSTDALKALIGTRFDSAAQDKLRQMSGAAQLRAVRPGEMMTMDVRADRLTVRLDAEDRIVALNCG